MKFSQAIRTVYRDKYFFEGNERASRSEFWWSKTLIFVYLILKIIIAHGHEFALFELSVLELAFYPALIGVYIRRLHDIDLSGWWLTVLLGIRILYGIAGNNGIFGIVFIVLNGYIAALFAKKGTTGENRFGPDPLTEINGF